MTQLAGAILPTESPTLLCRACKSSVPRPFFDMGLMPLANGFLDSPDDPEERFPLVLCRCDSCGMVQLGHVVPKEKLYEDYNFRTGSSEAMVEHFRDLIINSYKPLLDCDAPIIEIASNDGSVLSEYVDYQRFQDFDPQVMGIDPARNLCTLAAIKGIATVPEYFSERLAQVIARNWHGHLSPLIVACNVLGHVDDLDDFLRGVKLLLHSEGRFVFEVPYLHDTMKGQYDQIYQEHLNFFSINALARLMTRNGMRLDGVQHFDVHGGTIRGTVVHATGDVHNPVSKEVGASIFHESAHDPTYTFESRALKQREALKVKILRMVRDGMRVVAYGASAKGSIVLNYCGIGDDLIEYVIDSTPEKVGKYMPGTRQLIISPSKDSRTHHYLGDINSYDAIILLAWNHAAEIKAKHPEFKGEWILPHEVQ